MRAAEIVERLGGRLDGDGDVDVTGLTGVEFAGPTDATFAMIEKDLVLAEASPAICVLADETLRASSKTLIRCAFPMAYAAELSELLHPEPVADPGVHASAIIDPTTKLDETVHVGPLVTIGARCRIGCGVHILAGARIGNDCCIGDDCCIHENVTLYRGCMIGSRVRIHAGAVIGADGFGYFPHQGTLRKWPHVGDVVIEDDVEIGANSCIDRAKFGTTLIGAGSKIDNLVQVAHNCQLGKMVILAGQTGIGGSAVLEDGVVCAGQAGVADHRRIGAGATLGAQAGALTDIEAGVVVFGTPAVPQRRAYGHAAMLEFLIEHRRELRKLLKVESKAGDE